MAEPRSTALDLRLDGLISISGDTTISHGSIFHSSVSVIVKEIAFQDITAANQALHEAMVQKRLEHPNVCKLYDCYLQRDDRIKVVLVMERLQSDLKTAIVGRKREGKLWEEGELVLFCREMVAALAYAQTCGIAHRDIKPENIFLDRNRYKLGDFGASIAVATDLSLPSPLQLSNSEQFSGFLTGRSSENTHVHASLPGNLQYSSPEYRQAVIQAMSQGSIQAPIDYFKADMYSLGLVLLEMALLEFPEEAKDVNQLESRLPGCIVRVTQQYPALATVLPAMLAVSAEQRLRFTEMEKVLGKAEKRPIVACEICGKEVNDTGWIRNLDLNIAGNRGKYSSFCSEQCFQLSLSSPIICVGCGGQFTAKETELVSFPCPSKHVFHSAECLFEYICALTTNFSDPAAAYTCPTCHIRVIKEEVAAIFEPSAFGHLMLEAYQNSCCVCHQSTEVWRCKRGHVLCKKHQYTVLWKTKCPVCNNKTRLLTC